MKFKIGDKVRVKEELETDKIYGFVEGMKKYKGRIVTILDVIGDSYRIKEDNPKYWWSEEMFKTVSYSYEDLYECPIGTKIVFDCGEVLIRTGKELFSNSDTFHSVRVENLKGLEHESFGKVVKIEEPSYSTVYEAKLDVLDEVEKEYLGNVIKPFRDRVICIAKFKSNSKGKYITIGINDKGYIYYIDMPYFTENTMYKGMELDKKYSLEELNLK